MVLKELNWLLNPPKKKYLVTVYSCKMPFDNIDTEINFTGEDENEVYAYGYKAFGELIDLNREALIYSNEGCFEEEKGIIYSKSLSLLRKGLVAHEEFHKEVSELRISKLENIALEEAMATAIECIHDNEDYSNYGSTILKDWKLAAITKDINVLNGFYLERSKSEEPRNSNWLIFLREAIYYLYYGLCMKTYYTKTNYKEIFFESLKHAKCYGFDTGIEYLLNQNPDLKNEYSFSHDGITINCAEVIEVNKETLNIDFYTSDESLHALKRIFD